MAFAGWQRCLIITVALAVACSLVSTVSAAHAAPSTPEIEQKQAEADAANAELERMRGDLEVQVEEYNAITEAVAATREEIRIADEELDEARRQLAAAQAALGERAANIYRSGGTSAIEFLLGVQSFEDLIVRFDLMRRISSADAQAVADVKDAKARVEARAEALEQRQAEQLALQQQAEARASAIEQEVARQERFVARLDADVQALIAAEEERRRALEAERARQAAAAAAAAAQQRPAEAAASGSAAPGTTTGRTPADPGSLSSGDASVVDVALQYLGVRYVWGGASPTGFDCSGLMQYCYRQVGIMLPRTSRAQYMVGQHIAPGRLDLLLPGDLVFFGTGGDPSAVHHVGMYVGDGNYLHAPHRGAVVRIDSLTGRIAESGDYVGACRP